LTKYFEMENSNLNGKIYIIKKDNNQKNKEIM
jgi:hypothetical protein